VGQLGGVVALIKGLGIYCPPPPHTRPRLGGGIPISPLFIYFFNVKKKTGLRGEITRGEGGAQHVDTRYEPPVGVCHVIQACLPTSPSEHEAPYDLRPPSQNWYTRTTFFVWFQLLKALQKTLDFREKAFNDSKYTI
jgi:hypothetical protein